MRKRTVAITISAVLAMALLFVPTFATKALAADKIGWVGPVYTELSDSLTKGFKDYYKKNYGKEVDITFVRPGGWPRRGATPALLRVSLSHRHLSSAPRPARDRARPL